MSSNHQFPPEDTGGNINFTPFSSIISDKSLISIYWTDIINKPSFCNVSFTGSYNDLSNKPLLTSVATSGSYNDLSGKSWFISENNTYSFSNIGIGTANPNYKLDVSGDINFTGSLNQNGLPFKTSQWTNSNTSIYYNLGNVGIGKTTAINEKLDINGNLRIAGNIYPATTSNYDLGSSNNKWRDLYLSGNSIYLDNLILSKNTTNNLEIKDNTNNYKGIVINELTINSNNFNNKINVDERGFLVFNNSNYPVFFANNYDYSNIVLSNVLTLTSNNLNSKITAINTDTILLGNTNRFIVNNIYNRDITFTGTLTSSNIITSNLSVIGDTTILNTTVYQTEQLQVNNNTPATSMLVTQVNNSYNLAEFYNNSSLALVINSTGNIGIGNATPSYKLDVGGTINTSTEIFIKGTNVSNIIDGKISSASNILVNYNNLTNRPSLATVATTGIYSDLIGEPFITTGNDIYSAYSGNTGIGIATPGYKLDVNGTINTSSEIFLKGTNVSNIIDNKITITSNILVNYNNLTNRPSLATVATTGNYNDLTIKPLMMEGTSNYNDLTNKTWINNGNNIYNSNSANVGIGIATPAYKLDVNGNINTNSEIFIKGTNVSNIIDGKITATSNILVNYNNLTNRPLLATVATSGNYNDLSGKPSLATVATTGNYSDLINEPFLTSVNDVYSSYIGNTGIGIATPAYKLDVNGTVNTSSEIFIKGTNVSNIIDVKVSNTSNTLNSKITAINTDTIPLGTTNRFIVNDIYNRNIIFTGTLTSSNVITSNLSVIGDTTILNTTFYQTEQLQVVNDTTATALIVKQMNATQNLAEFYNNTTPALVINSTGNIGIGNATPSYKLDVSGTINASTELFIKGTNVSNIIDGKINSTSNILVNYNNLTNRPSLATVASTGIYSDLIGEPFITTGNDIYSAYSGNTGIGIATPVYKLDVNGTINTSSEILIKGTNISNIIDNKITITSNILVNYNNLTNRPSLATVATTGNYNDLTNLPTISSNQSGGVSDYNLLTNTPWINYNSTTIFSSNNSNVGIGRTNPVAKLDVNGDINIQGNLRISNVIVPFSTYVNTNITTSNGLFSYNNNYGYYTFLSDGSITFPQATNCDLIVVGAGGNGGLSASSGGGGAGEVIYYPNYPFSAGTSNITIGDISFDSNIRISRIWFNNNPIITARGGGDGGMFSTIVSQVFSYTGTIQTFTVPNGVTSVNVYCWGAGGGNTITTNSFINAMGGNGGFVKATLTIPSGTTSLAVIVGQGGRKGVANTYSGKAYGGGGDGASFDTSWSIGGGGGLSGIFVNDANMTIVSSYKVNTNATPFIIAGAGGGAGSIMTGYGTTNNHGGNGGSDNGNNSSGTQMAGGGTQTAGGTGSSTGVGSKYTGGTSTTSYAGGGGAGWYGGGASDNGPGAVGGGGGGSSYINNSYTITNITNLKTTTNGTATAPGNTETYYQSGIAVGAAATTTSGGLANGGNGLVVIEYTQFSTGAISGGSGGGGGANSTGAVAGTKWNATYSYSTAGANGSATVGGNGGSATANGGFVEGITSNSLILGVGGSGASATSVPSLKTTFGSGGDGNGGLGTQGIVIIKVPLNQTRARFDGYINYSNIDNRPFINDLVASRDFINLGYYNQINFPRAITSWSNEWFLYMGNSPTNVSNSFIFHHLNSNVTTRINSKWWFNGTTASTNNEISDIRIKKEIIEIINPLEKLMLIHPKEYYLCDEKDYLKKYGIIAQEVKEVLPEFVYNDNDYIANVYSKATYEIISNNNESISYRLIIEKQITGLININDELKILLDNNYDNNQEIIIEDLPYHNRYKKRFAFVKAIIDNHTIEINQELELSEEEKINLFIYGKKVNDFQKLDYSSLYCLNLKSTQELYSKIQQQELLISNLENRLSNLENKN